MAGKLFPKKKNKTAPPPGANGYYLTVAKHVGRAKWITVFALFIALFGCVIFARDEISLHNFQYLMKHFDVNSADNGMNFSVLRYNSDGSYRFGYYKDDLVIVSSTGIDFYDMRGNAVLSKTHAMSSPLVIATDRNLYVYDQGNCSYSVYDSFFGVKNVTTDYPITKMAASDSGVFAVVTKSLEYRSAVYIYDKNMRERSKVLKDKLVMDAAVSKDGSRVVLLSCDTGQDGAYFTELQSVSPGKPEAVFTVTLADCFPVSCFCFDDGGVGVLTSDGFIAFNSRGERVGDSYFEKTPTAATGSGDFCAVSFHQNVIGAKSTLQFLGTNGKVEREVGVDGQIKKMSSDNSYVYALLTDAVARIDRVSGEVRYEFTEDNPLDFVARDDSSLLLCYGNRTQTLPYAFSGITAQGEEE